jgi:hypothetical protein
VTAPVVDSRPSRGRAWVKLVGGLVVLGLVVGMGALLGVVLLDDGNDDDSSSRRATTTTTAPRGLPDDPEAFAHALYGDWKADDVDAAAEIASRRAVAGLFSVAYQPLSTNAGDIDPFSFSGCEGAAGSVICAWDGQDGAQIIMTVRNLTGGLPIRVVDVEHAGG